MSQLILNLVEGSVSFDYSADAARQLKSEIAQLMQTFKVEASDGSSRGEKPKAQPSLDYRFAGPVFFECFCNPNIWPTPFAAKVLLTIRSEHIRLTTEAALPRLNDDLATFLEQNQ